jgi:hypothetical protein
VQDVPPPVAIPLPRSLTDPRPVVGAGTMGWFAAALTLLIIGGPVAWTWACLCGGLLGLIGFGMMHWQRSAARRGARGARRDLL